MKILNSRNFFTLFLFAIVLALVIVALGYPIKASIGPLVAGIAALILLFAVFINDNTNIKRKTKQEENKEDKVRTALTFRDYRGIILWILGLIVLSYLFGIMPIFPLFILAYIKVRGFSWRLSIIVAACVFIVMFGGYKILLHSPLYEGFIFERLL